MIEIPQKLIDAGARVYATFEGCGVGLLIRTPRKPVDDGRIQAVFAELVTE